MCFALKYSIVFKINANLNHFYQNQSTVKRLKLNKKICYLLFINRLKLTPKRCLLVGVNDLNVFDNGQHFLRIFLVGSFLQPRRPLIRTNRRYVIQIKQIVIGRLQNCRNCPILISPEMIIVCFLQALITYLPRQCTLTGKFSSFVIGNFFNINNGVFTKLPWSLKATKWCFKERSSGNFCN